MMRKTLLIMSIAAIILIVRSNLDPEVLLSNQYGSRIGNNWIKSISSFYKPSLRISPMLSLLF